MRPTLEPGDWVIEQRRRGPVDRGDDVSLSRQAVELLEAEHQVAVNARVAARIADTDSAVLDILA